MHFVKSTIAQWVLSANVLDFLNLGSMLLEILSYFGDPGFCGAIISESEYSQHSSWLVYQVRTSRDPLLSFILLFRLAFANANLRFI